MDKRADNAAALPRRSATIPPTGPAMDFRIRIAGQTIAVRATYATTRLFCADYLTEAEADFSLEITAEDIAFERTKDPRSGDVSDAYLETVALLRQAAEKLMAHDTLLFHGSVVAADGEGYLFTAPSGTGKSTHTRLWRQMLGSRAVMINDDKPFLQITETGVLAWGSPWNGKHRLDTNTSAPLRAICILERSEENHIRRIPAREALACLFRQSHRPADPAMTPRYMALLDALAQNVAFYRMGCNMDPEAARMAYRAMAAANDPEAS